MAISTPQATWLPGLILDLLRLTFYSPAEPNSDASCVRAAPALVARFLELLVELCSQHHTRKVLLTLLEDWHVVALLQRYAQRLQSAPAPAPASTTAEHPATLTLTLTDWSSAASVIARYVPLLRYYTTLPIHQYTGRVLTPVEAEDKRGERLSALQRLCYTCAAQGYVAGLAGGPAGGGAESTPNKGHGRREVDVGEAAAGRMSGAFRDVAFATPRSLTW